MLKEKKELENIAVYCIDESIKNTATKLSRTHRMSPVTWGCTIFQMTDACGCCSYAETSTKAALA